MSEGVITERTNQIVIEGLFPTCFGRKITCAPKARFTKRKIAIALVQKGFYNVNGIH